MVKALRARLLVLWRRSPGVCIAMAVLASSLLSLSPYFVSSTEVVRMRNALLFTVKQRADFEWTPASMPSDFKAEQGPPDPMFADLVRRLRLESMPTDFERAVAISVHLLGSSPKLVGGGIQSGLHETYDAITREGRGYCADFVRVFMAMATAAGIPVRSWAFSFDDFGGEGHILPEIWNRQLGRWQLIGIFFNFIFIGPDGEPMSGLEFRDALYTGNGLPTLVPLHPGARPGFIFEDKAFAYYVRGAAEWYMWWGNNTFSFERSWSVRLLRPLGRGAEQIGAVLQGVHPAVAILANDRNVDQIKGLQRVRVHLGVVTLAWAASLIYLLARHLLRRRQRRVPSLVEANW